MSFIADFHIHSRYSRATSNDMDISSLTKWAAAKGIAMLGTGDFTHPSWFAELKSSLEGPERGVYRRDGIYFVLTAEVSNIYFKAGRTRKVHNIIFAPDLNTAAEINSLLSEYGDLSSDGRPVLNLECDRMVKLLSAIDENILCVPSHAWTPHFSIFGSRSGFDSAEECFEDQTPKILSIETGLSSDPEMNWRWSSLDRFTLMSNSDAHSPSKIGREANVFKEKIDYPALCEILRRKNDERFLYTIEFFPEEGKYHWDGHRLCGVALSPAESSRNNNMCPVCGKKVTIGVMHRVEELADRKAGFVPKARPSFRKVVPLAEIVANALGRSADSLAVQKEYMRIIKNLKNEMNALLYASEDDLYHNCPTRVAEGIMNVRNGNVKIEPGYDGKYGKVKVLCAFDLSFEKQENLL
ncbi:MAG: endonuclease Q family protein [Candidatus Omnitrophica bacterium]|nr:endonuclease Q family protein [Candidatus Omnitrophota bacterium]MCM8791383.1 endonuclease Q family protein [Candidatus Omnitrophota bacterium]